MKHSVNSSKQFQKLTAKICLLEEQIFHDKKVKQIDYDQLNDKIKVQVLQSINNNEFQELIDNDIFYIINQWFQLLQKDNPKLSEIFNISHLIVRNCKSEDNLLQLIENQGFVHFVQDQQKFLKKGLFYDYVTFIKKIVEKIDKTRIFSNLQYQIEKLLDYYSEEENLINTQIKSIFLSLIQSQNQYVLEFTKSKKFQYYIFAFNKQLLQILQRLQNTIENDKILEVKKLKSELDDFLYFLDDWVNLQQNDEERMFQINVFFIQFILNIFQPYTIREQKVQSINLPVIFYVVNNLLYITKKSENQILQFFTNYFDKMPIKNKKFQDLIECTQENGLGFFLHNYEEIIELQKFSILDQHEQSECEQEVTNDLLIFVKTKDDNLILQTSNLLLHIVSTGVQIKDDQTIKINILERLVQQPIMRQITFEKCFKLLDYLKLEQQDQLMMKKIGHFIVQNINQQFQTDQGRELIANFRRYILENQELLENIRPQCLKETALINYNTLQDQKLWIKEHQKELKFNLEFEEQYRVFICLFQIWAELYVKYFPEILKIDKIQQIFEQQKTEIENKQVGEIVRFQVQQPPMQIFFKGKEAKTKIDMYLGFLNHYFYFFKQCPKSKDKMDKQITHKCHFTEIYYQQLPKSKQILFFSQDKSFNLKLNISSQQCIENIPKMIKKICDNIIEDEKKLLQTLVTKFIKQIITQIMHTQFNKIFYFKVYLSKIKQYITLNQKLSN